MESKRKNNVLGSLISFLFAVLQNFKVVGEYKTILSELEYILLYSRRLGNQSWFTRSSSGITTTKYDQHMDTCGLIIASKNKKVQNTQNHINEYFGFNIWDLIFTLYHSFILCTIHRTYLCIISLITYLLKPEAFSRHLVLVSHRECSCPMPRAFPPL